MSKTNARNLLCKRQSKELLKGDGLYLIVSGKDAALHGMQFTGFHDKNGKDTYEGDIVTDREWHIPHNTTIRFSNGCFWGRREVLLYEDVKFTLEGIGNIYENPELKPYLTLPLPF